ncbi:hypothetical protein [Plantactinospora sp. GCM10030261]
MPRAVTEAFPDVRQEDWDALLRLNTLVFVALERPLDSPDRPVGH